MPYCIVLWKRGTNTVEISGLKPDDLEYLEKIPCMSSRLNEVDSEGFVTFGPSQANRHNTVKIAVVLTGLEVLGFKVVTTTAAPSSCPTNSKTLGTEYSWTLRREFEIPEPQEY